MTTKARYCAVLAAAFAASAWPHSETHAPARQERAAAVEEKAFGRPGDPAKAARTVRIDMTDAMRYAPALVRVKRGETIHFEVKNSGKVLHEIVLGTLGDLKAHAALMRKHPGMEHDEPNMLHVAPGRTERLVWQFTRAGEIHYGCLVPGHFEAGMVGRIVVE